MATIWRGDHELHGHHTLERGGVSMDILTIVLIVLVLLLVLGSFGFRARGRRGL